MTTATHEEVRFPRGALVGASLLLSFAMVVSVTARMTDVGATRLSIENPVETLSLTFRDLPDGSIGVVNAETGKTIDTLAPGKNGFVRVVMRSFAFERGQSGIGQEAPFRLMTLADGRTVIQDVATERVVTLKAFGWSNAAAFAELFEKGRPQK